MWSASLGHPKGLQLHVKSGKTKRVLVCLALGSLWNVCFCRLFLFQSCRNGAILFSHSTRMPPHAYFTVYPKCAWLVVASCCACVGICRHVCFSMGVSRATAIAALRCICGRSYTYIGINMHSKKIAPGHRRTLKVHIKLRSTGSRSWLC